MRCTKGKILEVCSDVRNLVLDDEQNVVITMLGSEFEWNVAFTTNKLLLLIDTLE